MCWEPEIRNLSKQIERYIIKSKSKILFEVTFLYASLKSFHYQYIAVCMCVSMRLDSQISYFRKVSVFAIFAIAKLRE